MDDGRRAQRCQGINVPLPETLQSVQGAQQLYDWFGYWPEFHDAVVLKLDLRLRDSSLAVHTWRMTNRVDARGFYELEKRIVVEFALSGVTCVTLNDLWANSILLDLTINRVGEIFRLELSSAYGLNGTIEAESLSLLITPDPPSP